MSKILFFFLINILLISPAFCNIDRVTITDIICKEKSNGADVIIQGKGIIKYSINRPDPMTMYIEIDNAILNTKYNSNIQNKDIKIEQKSISNKVSIIIKSNKNMSISIPARISMEKLNIKLTYKPGSSDIQIKKKTDEIKKKTEKIINITYRKTDKSRKITILFSGSNRYKWQRLKSPDNRFYIDFENVILPESKITVPSSDEILSDIKIAQFQTDPHIVRLVFTLNKIVDINIREEKNTQGKLIIDIGNDIVNENNISFSGEGYIAQYNNSTAAVPVINNNSQINNIPKIIVIDPGHGGGDSGAINKETGIMEKNIALDIALHLEEILCKDGWKVILTRSTDKDVSYEGSPDNVELQARVDVANKANCSVFISIHCDAATRPEAHGSTTFYYKDIDKLLAADIQDALIADLGTDNRGIKKEKFYLLKQTKMPAVLIEVGFLSNNGDARLLSNPQFRKKAARAIYNGIQHYRERSNIYE